MNTVQDSQLEFDLGDNEVATDVAVIDAPVEKDDKPAPVESERHRSELEAVNDSVQKRISKLTARMRESERREQAAVEYARGLQNQTNDLQQKLVHTDYSRLSETKTRLEGQQATLKTIIRKAREEGDIDTETEAQQRLAEMGMEQRQVAGWLHSQGENIQQQQRQQQQPQAQQAPSPPKPVPSPKAENWAERNPWFGQDRMMTYAAWGIHQTMIEQEGVDPNSDEYYTELDKRLREELPKRFVGESNTRQQRIAPAVAPATRSSGVNGARRTVRLSPSQVAIAKKLNVPLEEYAKYVKD